MLCTTDHGATAEILSACDPIVIGDKLKPLPQIPIPIVRTPDMVTYCDPASDKAQGYIVNAKDFEWALGEGSVVEDGLARQSQRGGNALVKADGRGSDRPSRRDGTGPNRCR